MDDALVGDVIDGIGFGEGARRNEESGKRRVVIEAAGRSECVAVETLPTPPPPGRARPADSFCSARRNISQWCWGS